MTSTPECARVVSEALEKLGGLDIVIANAGWTKFSDFGDLDALDYDEWDKVCTLKSPILNFHLPHAYLFDINNIEYDTNEYTSAGLPTSKASTSC
jgi:hypothetical protein